MSSVIFGYSNNLSALNHSAPTRMVLARRCGMHDFYRRNSQKFSAHHDGLHCPSTLAAWLAGMLPPPQGSAIIQIAIALQYL